MAKTHPYTMQFEAQRRRFYRSAKAIVRKALKAYRVNLENDLRTCSRPQEMVNEASKIINPARTEKALHDIYLNVGNYFARQTYAKLNSKKAGAKPQDIHGDYWLDYMESFVRQKLGQRITWITGTTEDVFKRTVSDITMDAVNEGLSISQLTDKIMDALKVAEEFRAERIARTEVISASNEASLAGAKATGLTLTKVWSTFIDDRTRDSHIAMDGEEVPMEERFSNGLECPGDTNGPAEEVINCRCTLLYNTTESDIEFGGGII